MRHGTAHTILCDGVLIAIAYIVVFLGPNQ